MTPCRFKCMEGPQCDRYARVTIEDIAHERDRACPRHAVQALNRLAGARVIWDDSYGINEQEITALRLTEERSQLAPGGHGAMSIAAAPDRMPGTEDEPTSDRANTVNGPLTPDRTKPVMENPEYAAFARRILRACARRIGDGDIEGLVLMAELAETIDTNIRGAVTSLREHGYSWADIGARLGVTRRPYSNAGATAHNTAQLVTAHHFMSMSKR
jgi:hypothetical protein